MSLLAVVFVKFETIITISPSYDPLGWNRLNTMIMIWTNVGYDDWERFYPKKFTRTLSLAVITTSLFVLLKR